MTARDYKGRFGSSGPEYLRKGLCRWEISVDADLSLRNDAERVHDGLEHNFSNIKHVMVHVNPYEKVARAELRKC